MLTREEYEGQETGRLASFAVRASASRGRNIAEEEDPYRTIFQRDRDRIIHSSGFRRLEYKIWAIPRLAMPAKRSWIR